MNMTLMTLIVTKAKLVINFCFKKNLQSQINQSCKISKM